MTSPETSGGPARRPPPRAARPDAGIALKRVYAAPDASDGRRILVDRLWPRGLTRRGAQVDLWMKDVAPSPDLRRWFGHRPEHWAEFRRRYLDELDACAAARRLARLAASEKVTLLYAARDEVHNHARVLAEHIARRGGT